MTHRYHPNPDDKQTGHSGKSANDTNKVGNQAPTQSNEGQRTPESRHDRENLIGNNQTKVRGGSPQQPPIASGRGGGNSR